MYTWRTPVSGTMATVGALTTMRTLITVEMLVMRIPGSRNMIMSYIATEVLIFLGWRQHYVAKIQLDTTYIASPPGHSQFMNVLVLMVPYI